MSNNDDIFNDDFLIDDLINDPEESLEITSPEEDTNDLDKNDESKDLYLPKIMGSDIPLEFQYIVDRFLEVYKTLPFIDYEEYSKELSLLSTKQVPTTTLQMINSQLQKVQSCKDRLAEIYQDVIKSYSFKKRAVNILSDAWGKFASGSSSDKRKSDSAYRLSEFYLDLARIEALNGECDHVLKNLDSLNNNLSRQITIIQSQLKLYDIGRGSLPDFDFNKGNFNDAFSSLGDSYNDDKDMIEKNNELDSSKSLSPEELSF